MTITISGNGGRNTNLEKMVIEVPVTTNYCLAEYVDSYYNARFYVYLDGDNESIGICTYTIYRYNGEVFSSNTEYPLNVIDYNICGIGSTVYGIMVTDTHHLSGAPIVYNSSNRDDVWSRGAWAAARDYFDSQASKPLYVGVNGKAREVTDMYVGVNGRARKVTAIYVGVNGRAREVFKAT